MGENLIFAGNCYDVVVRRLAGQVKHLVNYQREVDKGKLTAVANFEKVAFRVRALRRSKVEDYTVEPLPTATYLCPQGGC